MADASDDDALLDAGLKNAAGADEIASPDCTGAARMASAMLRPHAAGFVDGLLSHPDAMRVVDVAVPPHRAACPLGALELRGHGYLVLGVRHQGQLQVNPGPDFLLATGSVLIVLASAPGKHELEQLLAHGG